MKCAHIIKNKEMCKNFFPSFKLLFIFFFAGCLLSPIHSERKLCLFFFFTFSCFQTDL